MKLLDKYNRISLYMTVVVMLITGIIYYYTISAILTNQIDKDLLVEEHEIFDYTRLNHKLPQVFKSADLQIYFKDSSTAYLKRRFLDTTYYDNKGTDNEAGRALQSFVNVQGKDYQILIIESKVETEDLIRIIFLITLGLILLVILLLFVINRLAIKKLWQPFYKTLNQIKLFNLADKNQIYPAHTGIEEFNELNESVSAMAVRVSGDYQELKTFVENASHELMTPIAVINSKLDTLIQTGSLSQRQSELLSDVYETVSKLTRLNKAMLLLTKVENKMIKDDQPVPVKEATEEALTQFQELFADKAITLSTDLVGDACLNMSRSLFDVLLNNLLSNALRHNYVGGSIFVGLSDTELVIKNTGRAAALDAGQIFNRFTKAAESEGSGLGLTLSRQICENYSMKLIYQYQDPLHVFTVMLPAQN